MDNIKSSEQRVGERHVRERRKANLPLVGKDRRLGARRSGDERRA